MRTSTFLLAGLFTDISLSLPQLHAAPRSAPSYPYAVTVSKARADAVKEAFQFAWDGYYNHAFPADELRPVSNTGYNSRNGWGATAIDALSTALLMRNAEVTQQILDHIPEINYAYTNTSVSLFETTIRYLGGMLSGYDLLKGPLSDLAGDKTANVDALLSQSKALADILSFAFDTPSGVPQNELNITSKTCATDCGLNGLATVGTLVLEWTRLSDLTGDPKYGELAQKGESYLLNPTPATGEPFPGLVAYTISTANGSFLDTYGGWSGGTDSFYEYLIKMYIYDPTRFELYRDRWILAVDSSIEYLASSPASRPDLTWLAAYRGKELILGSQHLTCFDGGNFILGGLVLKRQDYVDFGLKLVDGCRATYTATATGLGPEQFSWNTTNLPTNDTARRAFYEKNGFYITDGQYVLRPEVIESYYYAYRATQDPKYQDWAWEGFVAINKTTRVGSGFSSIEDVNQVGGGGFQDFQESFMFAEVLKYSYLIQAEEDPWQIDQGGKNEWVFNTEAHPFRVKASSG